MKNVLLICICLLFICTVCKAENEFIEKSRKIKKDEVIGVWKMTYQSVSPLFKDKSLFFADYQIFEFFEDGYFKNIASKKSISKAKVLSLLIGMPKIASYEFVDEGILMVERSKDSKDKVMISIAVDDFEKRQRSVAPLIKKGDLIVSYLDANMNIYMRRYLSKMIF